MPTFFLKQAGFRPRGTLGKTGRAANVWFGMSGKQENLLERVAAIADPVLEDEGLELVEAQYRRERNGWVLRLFIDAAYDPDAPAGGDKDGSAAGSGVTLDDCVAASREIGRLLDVRDAVPGKYTLEVSSPGLDRPLNKERDFQRFSGRLISVKYLEEDGRRKIKGRLTGLTDGNIVLEVNGETKTVPYDRAERIQLVPELDFGKPS